MFGSSGKLKYLAEKPKRYFINGGCWKLYFVGSSPFTYKYPEAR
jgi:hypothetical protein